MQSLPPSLHLPVHRTTCTPSVGDTAPILHTEIAVEPDQSRPATQPDRLSAVPSDLLNTTAQWLGEKEMLSLMQTSKRHHSLVNQYYRDRLKKDAPRSAYPARDFRNPALRIDQFLCKDQTGRHYLIRCGIHHPLSTKIQNRKMTVAQAQRIIQGQQKTMQSVLASGALSGRQKDYFSNPLLAEHFLCDRCDSTTLFRLASKGAHLFYSMTLQRLFRSGALVPRDLENLSRAGLGLLHDPLLVSLFHSGLINKDDVLHLTQTQFEALLICRPLLLRGKLSMKPVLALEQEQLISMRKAGLLDDLHAGRITLLGALDTRRPPSEPLSPAPDPQWPISGSTVTPSDMRRLLTKIPVKAIRDAMNSDDLDWIKSFGKVLHLLSPNTIIQYLDADDRSSLGDDQEEGLMSIGSDRSCAYMQLYIDLAQHLNSADFLQVVQPFLSELFGFLVSDTHSYGADYRKVFDQCAKIWALVRTKCVINGTPIEPYRDLVLLALRQEKLGTNLPDQSGPFWESFGRLLVVMEVLDSAEMFRILIDGWEWNLTEREHANSHALSCNQALFSLIDDDIRGAEVLDSILQGIQISKSTTQSVQTF